ncbi:MAG: flippase [Candidatus Pacebacteria bacterium]|nr:flippase [Candidatus Paceibacterota bacterium]
MNNQSKVLYNTAIQIISKVIATALGLIAMAMMTRYLGTTGFGEYTTIVTYISFFAIVADLGLTLITVQMISVPGVSEKRVLDNLLALRLISAIFFLSLGPLSVLFLPYENSIKVGVLILSLSFIFIALNQILIGLFQKRLRMDKAAAAEIFGRLILVLGVYVAIKNSFGLSGLLWASVIASFLNFALQYLLAQKFIKIGLKFDFKLWQIIIKKSWPLALIIVFNLIYLKTDTLILSIVKTQEDVGIYGAAYKIIEVIVTIPFMFSGLILPFLTVSWIKKDLKKFKVVLQKSYDFMLFLALPMIIAIQIIAPQLIFLIAGEEFMPATQVLKILILAAGLIFIGTIFSHAIIAVEKQKKLIPLYLFVSLTALAGYLIFIPKYSYFGAAWTTIYSEAIIALASIFYVYKFTNFLPKNYSALKAVFASTIMAVFLFFFPQNFSFSWPGLIIEVILATLIYFLSLYLLKGFSKKDLNIIK